MRLGVGRGDRVAAYLPNIAEALAAFFATASLGAVWSSCSPDFGVQSVVDRFAQIEPKVLLAVDGYRYDGRDHDRRAEVAEIAAAIPSLPRVVTLPYVGLQGDWDDAFPATDQPLAFERVPFDHPLYVLYSSGTTGLPKAIVHGHGGILLEHLEWIGIQCDLGPDDRFFWLTTTGWMMWNALVSGLLTPASIVLYDGSPGHPDMGVLWDLAEAAGITVMGVGAAYIHACMKAGVVPRDGRDLGRPARRSGRPARRCRRRASAGSTSTSAIARGSSRRRAAPTSAPRSSAASRPSPCAAARSRCATSAPPSRRSTSTAGASSTRSASWC